MGKLWPDMEPSTIGTTIGWSLLRWAIVKSPEWIARRLYPDARLAQDVRIKAMEEGEGATLGLARIWNIPRLVVRLKVDNVSPYRRVQVERLVGSIERVVDFTYEGWTRVEPEFPRLLIDIALTTEQENRLRELASAPITIVFAARLFCDGRPLKKNLTITTRLTTS